MEKGGTRHTNLHPCWAGLLGGASQNSGSSNEFGNPNLDTIEFTPITQQEQTNLTKTGYTTKVVHMSHSTEGEHELLEASFIGDIQKP